MLVSVALVTVIMLLFTQVFTLASSSITDQREFARNSQRARAISQVLRSDLAFRTFRQRSDAQTLDVNARTDADINGAITIVDLQLIAEADSSPLGIVPLAPGDIPDKQQAGYFYISENNPASDIDDVLQFTILIDDLDRVEATLQQFYGGNVAEFNNATGGSASPINQTYNLGDSTNQPEDDDGFSGGLANAQTRTRAAEVAYWLRGGNLYRRVMLLREPAAGTVGELSDGQPSYGDSGLGDRLASLTATYAGTDFAYPGNYDSGDTTIAGVGSATGRPFWQDFDLSATRIPFDADSNGEYGWARDKVNSGGNANWGGVSGSYGVGSGFWLNTTLSLDNTAGKSNRPIALPWMRFGHIPYEGGHSGGGSTPGPRRIGFPVEWGLVWDGSPGSGAGHGGTATPAFIGRLTMGETAALAAPATPDVVFPGAVSYLGPRQFFTGTPYAAAPSGAAVREPTAADLSNPLRDYSVVDIAPMDVDRGSVREFEDLVLSGVTAFDIDVWDDLNGVWVDLGQAGSGSAAGSAFAQNRWSQLRQSDSSAIASLATPQEAVVSISQPSPLGGTAATLNTTTSLPGLGVRNYGPGGFENHSINNVFDTWHTHCDITSSAASVTEDTDGPGGNAAFARPTRIAGFPYTPDGDGVYDLPPYRPMQVDHRVAMIHHFANGVSTAAALPATTYTPMFWLPRSVLGTARHPGNVAFGSPNDVVGAVTFANPYLAPYADVLQYPNGGGGSPQWSIPRLGEVGSSLPGPLRNGAIGFRCVEWHDTDGDSQPDPGAEQPRWPSRPGQRVSDGELVWEAFENRVGLKKMRITIRYTDPRSQKSKQISMVHSFVE